MPKLRQETTMMQQSTKIRTQPVVKRTGPDDYRVHDPNDPVEPERLERFLRTTMIAAIAVAAISLVATAALWVAIGIVPEPSWMDDPRFGWVFLSALVVSGVCDLAASQCEFVRERRRDQHTIRTSDFEDAPDELRTLFVQGCATLHEFYASRAYREGWLGELDGSERAAWCYADNLHRAHRLQRQTEEVKAAATHAGVDPMVTDARHQYTELLSNVRTDLAHFTAARDQAAAITSDLDAQDLDLAESRRRIEALEEYQRAQKGLDASTLTGYPRNDVSLAADLQDVTSARVAGYRAVRS